MKKQNNFLVTSLKELQNRGWQELDIILISGDAYVDHHSYGVSLIGRVLEAAGFKVGLIAQPNWKNLNDFTKLGKPNLFFGISAGNLDSMVANYTANKKPRKKDAYSPEGQTGLRPDRATIVYTNKVKAAFKDVPIILGGIEASLRRLAHYDYWDNTIRRSILLDTKADLLVYGMGEQQIVTISQRLKKGEPINRITNIPGTVMVQNNLNQLKDFIEIPSFEDINKNKNLFNQAYKLFYQENNPFQGKTIVQKHQNRYIVHYPPAPPLPQKELDNIYQLPFKRTWHPVYNQKKGIPGFSAVEFSITSHRGCCGECSFCSLSAHQGKIIQSRSEESILREVDHLTSQPGFKGTITDIGGPTANLYQAKCDVWEKKGTCYQKKCLYPEKCKNLNLGYKKTLQLWDKVLKRPKVKHLFIGSGLRYDLLIDSYAETYLLELCKHHISGQLKIAPEHISNSILNLMHKPLFKKYEIFVKKFKELNQKLNKKQYLVNYFISSHPGADLETALELTLYLNKQNLHPEQIQDFIPLPMTLSTCFYYTEEHPFSQEKVYVAKTFKERKMQRALLQYQYPLNRKLVLEALTKLNRLDLKKKLL